MASDYSISQFRFLARLMLVHGALAHARTTKLILYSFYKNMTLALTNFWFGVFSGYSGQFFFDPFLGQLLIHVVIIL